MLNSLKDLLFSFEDTAIKVDVFFGQLNAGVLILNEEHGIKYCNQKFADLFNADREDLKEKKLEDVLKDTCWADFFELLAIAPGHADTLECDVLDELNNRKYKPRIVSQPGLTFIMLDSEPIRADHRDFMISSKNLNQLINIAEIPIWLVDHQFNLILSNKAFERWINHFVGRELQIGENIIDVALPTEYLAKFTTCYELALTGKHFTTVEDMTVDGEVKFATINFSPLFDAEHAGKIIGISCSASDITVERKHLSRLDAQAQLLAEIAETQSHKVRGPVSTLLGLVQIFNFEDITDPVNMEVMYGVQDTAQKLDVIVRSVIRNINRWGNTMKP